MYLFKRLSLALVVLSSALTGMAQNTSGLFGKWQLIPDESSSISYYKTIGLDIRDKGSNLEIVMKWEAGHPKVDSLYFATDGRTHKLPVNNRVWPYQVFSSISMIPGTEKSVSGSWVAKNKVLEFTEQYPVSLSQGIGKMKNVGRLTLSDDGEKLTLNIVQNDNVGNSRTYVFRRGAPRKAYFMRLKKGWKIDGLLPENAFLISLQGIVNTDSAALYFIYPEGYDYNFTGKLFDFYKQHLGYSFQQIGGLSDALNKFKNDIKGYIIWDKEARTSLNVAFTLAGLKKAVVITSDMLPLVKSAGLEQIADFREMFRGKSDLEVYKWAYDHYWEQCNKKYIVWMGGVTGPQMMPGIADFGISKGSFFTDLSTDPKDTAEYNFADKIMGEMPPLSMVMGWHSYAKDLERNYVTLASHHGLRVEGLNTFPNVSFTSRTPPSPGFEFKNNHNVVPKGIYTPKKKVYITCIQTDGLGLGAWNDSTRGSIPYAWEVTINWQWIAPILLEYYYSKATPNDFFIGCLSGPGYMYPKAIPKRLLPPVIKTADTLLKKLDLNVFEIMDYSEGSTVVGNSNLPKYIVDAYYENMPDVIGFLNGYAPSYTFYEKEGRPFISYDYYLDENQPENDAVSDLKALISLNSKRPYFLALHVREWNSIARVKRILSQLGSDVEVVPLDIFLKMAGNNPTYKTRFLNTDLKKRAAH